MQPQNNYFSQKFDTVTLQSLVEQSLRAADEGELFVESCFTESISLNDGIIKTASYNERHGYGLRAVKGEAVGFTHSNQLEISAIAESVKLISDMLPKLKNDQKLIVPVSFQARTPNSCYKADNPFDQMTFNQKVKELYEIEAYMRGKSPVVKQVTLTYVTQWQKVMIVRPHHPIVTDVRPLHRLGIQIIIETPSGQRETASQGTGGRLPNPVWLSAEHYKPLCDDVLRQALVNSEAKPAPAGEFPVILGPGWPGILLHEAVGHGLEGDFNRKKTSLFSDQMGKQVAARGVTVIDDGTIPDRRGSLNVDDEGTPSQRNVLIDDGILVGYMHDRHNAFLMGVDPTGNGRRETYAHLPMPRMTNTFMLAGPSKPDDIIRDVKNGIYAANFSGGQVDITSGQFVFEVCEAYRIENGSLTTPLKGGMLIGNGPDVMKKITHIGNDLALDKGIGTCGKDGQNVPVGVGQPTIAISKLTVGGTAI